MFWPDCGPFLGALSHHGRHLFRDTDFHARRIFAEALWDVTKVLFTLELRAGVHWSHPHLPSAAAPSSGQGRESSNPSRTVTAIKVVYFDANDEGSAALQRF